MATKPNKQNSSVTPKQLLVARAEQSMRDKSAALAKKEKLLKKIAKAESGVKTGLPPLTANQARLLRAMADPAGPACHVGGISNMAEEKLSFAPTLELDLSVKIGEGYDVPDGSALFVKRRDTLLQSLLYYMRSIATTVYRGKFYAPGGHVDSLSLSGGVINQTRPMPVAWKFVSGTQRHGPYLYPGKDDYGGKWVFLSKGEEVGFTYPAYVGGSWQCYLEQYQEGANPKMVGSPFTLAAGGGSLGLGSIPETGYYRFVFVSTSSTTPNIVLTNLQITTQTGAGCWAQLPVPQVETVWNRVEDFRIVGSSLLVSPHPSVTNLAGDVIQTQYPADTSVVQTILTTLAAAGQANSKLKKPRSFYKGSYSFVKPGDLEDDMQMIRELRTDAGGVLTDATYDIVPRCPFVVHYVANIPEVSTAYPGAVFQVTYADSVNNTSSLAWAALEDPDTTWDDLLAAWERLKLMENHLENPTHLESIARAMQGLIGTASDIAGAVAPMAGQYGPALMAGSALGKMVAGL